MKLFEKNKTRDRISYQRSTSGRRKSRLLVIIILGCFTSCKDNENIVQPPPVGVNPSILLVRSYVDSAHLNITGDYKMGDWSGSTICCCAPLRRITLDQDLRVVKDTILELYKRHRYITISKSGEKLLYVHSLYNDVSIGALYLRDVSSGVTTLLKDSLYSVSSVRFWRCDQRCIYYSYGDIGRQIAPGYYSLDLQSGRDSLVLAHTSEVGPTEITNGFDISPDGRRLLIPLHHYSEFPRILEYDLYTGDTDTLKVDFIHQFLWLRYDPTGTDIVYSNYPSGSGGGSVADTSEMGIINRATCSKRVLDVNTRLRGHSISLFPNWSPDGKHIVYGNAPGPATEPLGAVGFYSLYILKNVY